MNNMSKKEPTILSKEDLQTLLTATRLRDEFAASQQGDYCYKCHYLRYKCRCTENTIELVRGVAHSLRSSHSVDIAMKFNIHNDYARLDNEQAVLNHFFDALMRKIDLIRD